MHANQLELTLGECCRYSTWVVLAGTVCVVSSNGNSSSRASSIDELLENFTSAGFVVYILIIATLLSIEGVSLWRCENWVRDFSKNPEAFVPPWMQAHPLAAATLTGTIGAQSMVFAKAVSVVVLDSLGLGDNASSDLLRWEFYMFLFFLVVCLLLQTHFLNFSLKNFDALLILPIYTVSLILVSVMAASLCYQELSSMSALSVFTFWIGVAIICVGVFYLTKQHKTRNQSERRSRIPKEAVVLATEDTADVVFDSRSPVIRYQDQSLAARLSGRSSSTPSRQIRVDSNIPGFQRLDEEGGSGDLR